MLDPETAYLVWEAINNRALDMMSVSEQENGMAPAEGEQLSLLTAGIALGVSAAASYYKEHPDHVPCDD